MRNLRVISAIAFIVLSACEKVDTTGARGEEVMLDSLVTVLAPPPGLHSLDVFIYEASGLKKLQATRRVVAGEGGVGKDVGGFLCDSIRIPVPRGDKIIAAVGDSPYIFKSDAMETYDALTHLTVLYYDEDCKMPLKSGQVYCKAGDIVELNLSSSLVPIRLDEISQEFEGYDCLESPRVMLRDAPASVEIFREVGFRPSETVSDTLGMKGMMWENLGRDIGFYPLKPELTLYCYPNEEGPVRTSIVVEGRYRGRPVSFPYEFKSLKKGLSYSLKLFIGEDPETYYYEMNYWKIK